MILIWVPVGFLICASSAFVFFLLMPFGGCADSTRSFSSGLSCSALLATDAIAANVPGLADDSAGNAAVPVRSSDSGEMTLRRISPDREADEQALRHQYSRRQAWNSDESKLLMSGALLDAKNYSLLTDELQTSSASNWSNLNPDIIFGIRYDPDPNLLVSWNVSTGQIEPLYRFTDFKLCNFGFGEGNLSNDDRYVVVACRADEEGPWTLLSFDLESRAVLGTIEADPRTNWVSFSQSGAYIVVEINKPPETSRRLLRYNPDFSNETELTTETEHGDLGLTTDGKDIYLMTGGRKLRLLHLDSAKVQPVFMSLPNQHPGFGHISCRNIQRPGWCYISTRSSKQLAAVYIGASNALWFNRGYESWLNHGSSYDSYAVEAQASVSPSGKQAIFTSDWDGNSPAHDYVVSFD